jgi:hypothetical protein
MEFGGLDMQTLSKIVFSAVLVCLLLSLLGGGRRLRGDGRVNHVGRDRHHVALRLRRLRTDYPSHQPVRPSSLASIPPDEDDDDERFRLTWEDTRELTSALSEELLTTHLTSWPSAWPSPPNQPLYRTLCTLLI